MSTAVCIIPPDDAWDTIQRARHLAQDTTFFRWPPAIRLFHPFAPRGEVPGLVGKMAEWIEGEMPSGAGGVVVTGVGRQAERGGRQVDLPVAVGGVPRAV